MSKVYSLKTKQKIPVSLYEAWEYFSNPANLANLTPDKMGFKTISKHHGEKMYAGQVIEYKVSPLFGIPLYWMTEITHVADKNYFVDEQRFGPFKMWHHQHHFTATGGGVDMTDTIHYKLPFWFFGDLANWLFVRRQLKGIFAYRFRKVEAIFGVMKV